MNTEVSLATIDDIESLSSLLTVLFEQDIEFEPNDKKQKSGLTKIIDNPDVGEILIIKSENRIIGMVSLLFSISTVLGGKVAVLEDMVIHPDFRKKGHGTKLLNSAIDWAKENGILRITLLTDFDNEVAINYYKNNGFIKSPMIPMRLVFKK